MKYRQLKFGLFCALILPICATAQTVEPIKVLLARTAGVSNSLVRSTLSQANTTMFNSGLGFNHFQSASFIGSLEEVFEVTCPTSNFTILFLCLSTQLGDDRNTNNADIVLVVVTNLADCGFAAPGMINRPTISVSNSHLAYAVVRADCLTAPPAQIKAASHEIGHLLSLEHREGDPATSLPIGYPANHAAEDFDDLTVGGSPSGDCPIFPCDINDFFSEDGKTFPDGGAAGNSSFSNAKNVIQSASWDIVAAYRPLLPPVVMGSSEFAGCNGSIGQFLITWYELLNSTPADSFEVQRKSGSYWNPYFDGGSSCVVYTSLGNTNFRVRGINDAGPSPWVYFAAYHTCYDPGGGGAMQ